MQRDGTTAARKMREIQDSLSRYNSERAIYEAALDRLACEIAAVEGTEKAAAVGRINDHLSSVPA